MIKKQGYTSAILYICTVCFLLASCAAIKVMTPEQKYASVRTGFNDIVRQYIDQAKLQPEDVRAKLRENVNPIIKDAEEALDLYYAALALPGDDPDARLAFYLELKNKILELCLKYGMQIVEK